MKRNRLFIIFTILMMILSSVIAFADGEIYGSLDVQTNGDISIESITYNGKGTITTENTGVFTVNGSRNFAFKNLVPGDYYYRISMVDKGVEGVTYDKKTYTIWVYVEYDPSDPTGKTYRQSIVVQNDDDTTSKPDEIFFTNTKEETITVKRTITYTKYTADGEKMFDTIVQTVVLKRTVLCDSEGNVLKDENGNPIIIGSNGNPIGYDENKNPILLDENGNPVKDAKGNNVSTTLWQIDKSKSDLSARKSRRDGPAEGWDVDRELIPSWDDSSYDNCIDLNDPQDVLEHVIYTKEKLIEKTETITIKRTITYTEYTPDGKEVARPYVQEVTLSRTVVVDENGNIISKSRWRIDSPEDAYGAVVSPEKKGWTPDQPIVGIWDIDLDNPQDALVHVVYIPEEKPQPPTPKTGDNTNLTVYLTMAFASLIIIISIAEVRRKADKKN